MSGEIETQALSAEQDADLRRLESMAAQGDAPLPEAGQAGQDDSSIDAGPVLDPVQEAEAMFGFAVATISGFLPHVELLYPPERIRRMAVTYVPLAEKRGWDAMGWIEKYGLELAFMSACIPPQVWQRVMQMVKAMIQKRLSKKTEEKPEAPPVVPSMAPVVETPEKAADSGKTVTFGAPAAEVQKKAAPRGKSKA